MFKLIEFLKKRPSDVTIRVLRALISFSLTGLFFYTNGKFLLPFHEYYENFSTLVVYGIAGLFIIHAMVFGVLGLCVWKRGTMKKLQMFIWVVCILLGASISYPAPSIPSNTSTGSITLSDIASTSESSPIRVGGWIIFYGIFALLAGATGKMITGSCMKYKEVITKIRV